LLIGSFDLCGKSHTILYVLLIIIILVTIGQIHVENLNLWMRLTLLHSWNLVVGLRLLKVRVI
jgi:hypothetical protein